MHKILITLILFCLCNKLGAQPYYFRHYQVEDGLANNTVICSIQDDNGFMWFGTNEGLHRFDGYTFKIFRHDANDPASIQGDFITCLYKDKRGIIWVGTDNGLYSYNSKTERFNLVKGSQTTTTKAMQMDARGHLWAIVGYDLVRYDPATGKFQHFKQLKNLCTSVCIMDNNDIWVSTVTGTMQKYNKASGTFTAYNMFSKSEPHRAKWIEKVYNAGNGNLLIGTLNYGAKLFNVKTGDYKDILTPVPGSAGILVRDFVRNTASEYWIATESGIFVYNSKTGISINLKKKTNDPYSLSDNAVRSLCKDKEGGIWASTFFGGINYYQPLGGAFKKYFPQVGANSISGNVVRTIHPGANGKLWIATQDAGLNMLDTATEHFTHFMADNRPGSISHNNVHGLLADNNDLLISTHNHGLDMLNVNTGKVTGHFSNTADLFKLDFIPLLYKTRTGRIFAGTLEGMYEFSRETLKFNLLKEYPDKYFYISIFEDSQGTLWTGTMDEGLVYYNARTKATGKYKIDPSTPNTSRSNRANWIYEDTRKLLWIATDDGLCTLNRKTGKFTKYSTANGFPSNTFFAILEDSRQNLWISTSKGLVCYSPATQKIKTYTTIDGLLSDQFNYNSAYKAPNGRMYFGTVKGLISFHPDEITSSAFNPPVYITGFQVNNKELPIASGNSPLKKSTIYTDEITLPHTSSSFSIDFASLSYIVPEATDYAYRMEGLNPEWVHLQTNRKVYFTGLAPGVYTFYVKASNSCGSWSSKPAVLTIKILPPFWASTGACVLYVLLVAAGIYYLIRRYHKRTEEKHRNEKEKDIYRAKIDFFTNVAHEIRTPLTLIKGPMDVVIKNAEGLPVIKDNLQIMERNTDLLLDLTNQLLDFRKIESKNFSLYFVKINVSEIISNTYHRYKAAADQKKLGYKLTLPAQPCYAYADMDALSKIVSNLLDNAVKYADTRAQIQLLCNDTHFTLLVKNDGYLIPAELREKVFEPFYRLKETSAEAGSGIGLSFARSLAELHNGTLELQEPEKQMNVFALILPIHQQEEHEEDTEQPECAIDDTDEQQYPGKPAILIVDDNKEILKFISVNLGKDYGVITASNGLEALEILQKEAVQLVISDVMMPGMDGFELCRNIKSTIEYSHVPVILLTARNTMQAKIEGLETGADAYIEKPFSLEYLEAQITSLLANRDKVREHFANSPQVHLKTLAHSKAEEEFLEKLNAVIYDNLDDTGLDVLLLADRLNMSRRTLYRKIKAISNLSPNELINIARLKKAAELLLETEYKIYKIAKIVGFSSEEKLRRNFIKQFGVSPSEYVRKAEAKYNVS